MKCLFCGSDQSSVIDKRAVKSSGEIRRRRECLKCKKRYTTYERVAEYELIVIKRNGQKQPFNSDKIRSGLEKALEKRPGFEKIAELTERIERQIRNKSGAEVQSKTIGLIVLSELRKLDKVAYLRFASVYRNFETQADFEKELQHIFKKSHANI